MPAGHAVIQVESSGQNAILLYAGANRALASAEVPSLFRGASEGDWFLTQNETSCVPEALAEAHARGLTVCLNPAPMDSGVCGYPLDILDWLIVNESEGAALTCETSPEAILRRLREHAPRAHLVLTLGADGVWCVPPRGEGFYSPAEKVDAVDTTAAGDTFIGYLLASCLAGAPLRDAVKLACRAAALSVTRFGAADSIPYLNEVLEWQNQGE
jgi:ribokinase